jgi:hypothetical protein
MREADCGREVGRVERTRDSLGRGRRRARRRARRRRG